MHLQNLMKIDFFVLKILSENLFLTSFKGHNSVRNGQKWRLNSPKLDVVNINAFAKFGENPFLHSQVIERKLISDVIQGS